ncbi:unnamed protein product [Triticum turgidum subsp. durum]|uniref:Disease resistance protein RPM1 n=1 Tax=Triticum turgidum subsp. durum TaxID=4567 RepID=A0A9R1R592_TRITD|nr:unnamed protein product [Triticum turgidum subsp. durum]
MAEGVVGMLILKLGSALAIEAIKVGTGKLCRQAKASSIARLFGQIRDIKEELESMQSFLQEAERFKDTDNTTASFINKIRGLAFEIEDVVDEFTYKLEDKHGGFSVKIKRQFKRISTWRRLSLKLRDIKLKLENVDRRKARYDMRGIAIEARNSDAHCRSTDQTSYFPIEENLVGIDESKNLLINWLTSDFQQENVISTVWGMGGVGKTTLVAHVYNTLKIDFDCAAWVTVSKAYQVQDLLKQIIRELQKSDLKGELRVDIVDMEKRSLVEIIRDFLRGKKYLLVLDDVWGIDIWFKIRDAFPTNSTSRFVITSRIHDVALLATGNCMVELKPLEAHHSWELFCKEAFWKRLIRHWVTAGFIRETEHKTMEEVAEGYLYELVNRSLLQVVERNESGRVRSCRMHDIIRLLALAKSNEERFCRVHDGSVSSSAENTRRLSIQSPNIEQLTLSSEVQLRSIYVFDNGLTIDSLKPFLKSFKLLSTLDLQGSKIRRLPNEIFNMFNLRFLGLRDTEVEDIPKTVGRLQKLEVLDAYNAKLLSLPESVVTLRKLRYLYVATDPKTNIKGVVAWTGIQVPNGIRHLTDLQALQLVEASSETLCHLGALTELRTLSITKVQREQCVDLCNAIMNMTHLVSLAIMAINEKETLELEELCLPPTLSKLEIGGQLDRKRMPQIVSSFSDHENITLLALAFSKLDEDSFSCLLVLHGLRALWLDKAYEGKRLHFNAMTFPKLRLLSISDAPQLNDVVVEESALQSLVHLSLTDCPELKALPDGIEHLRTLEKLYLRGVSKDLTKKLQNKEKTNECNDYLKKINHVRRVTVYP